MDNGQLTIDNSPISACGKIVAGKGDADCEQAEGALKNLYLFRIVGEADTTIVHCTLSIVHSTSHPVAAGEIPSPGEKVAARRADG